IGSRLAMVAETPEKLRSKFVTTTWGRPAFAGAVPVPLPVLDRDDDVPFMANGLLPRLAARID
ncbi:MAG: hypothetical protein OEO83_20030, partial [Alphaproteobacteria bacterium]|nr:hypothetical protein [Alphaproteobacteria bacterium]